MMKLTNLLNNLSKPVEARLVWEEHSVSLQRREDSEGFGFAVSGNCGGEEGTVVVVEDIVRGGPAEGRLRWGVWGGGRGGGRI